LDNLHELHLQPNGFVQLGKLLAQMQVPALTSLDLHLLSADDFDIIVECGSGAYASWDSSSVRAYSDDCELMPKVEVLELVWASTCLFNLITMGKELWPNMVCPTSGHHLAHGHWPCTNCPLSNIGSAILR
jgi:hypothetical protein